VTPSFSVSIAHAPWKPERVECLREMLHELAPLSRGVPYLCHDTDYRGRPWAEVKVDWALKAWRWHLAHDATHCLLMSDDLALAPDFWSILEAMVSEAPHAPIGLMSNHPDGPRVFDSGQHWYRTRSWLVGPAIVIPHADLEKFVPWYERWYPTLPPGDLYGQQGFFHDDSSLNEWVSRTGRYSLHPLPAPIEHRLGLGRSHDAQPFPKHAAEWISWRRVWHANPGRETFSELPRIVQAQMTERPFWWGEQDAPMLPVV
jgi:hypothetical protein